MFGASLGQNKPAGGGIFGSSSSTNTPQAGGLFSGLGQNNQQNPQQQSGGLFSGLGQINQQQPGGLFSGLGQNAQQNQTQQQSGGLFSGLGQSTQNQPQGNGGLFSGLGQSTQQNQPSGGLFGGLGQSTQQNQPQGAGLFAGLGQNNQQQNNQQNQNHQTGGLFGGFGQSSQQQPNGSAFGMQSTQQQSLPQLGQSQALWQPNSAFNPRMSSLFSSHSQTYLGLGEKTIPEQMSTVLEKWDTGNPNCAFKHYFYNKVDDNMAPYYRPAPNEDPKAWEEALSKKPGPGFVPVLCTGFAQMGERIKLQQRNLANFNARLHEINHSLSRMMQDHETKTSIRAMDARRKHLVLKQRCLALATKVQVLRNRGYAMGGDEEDLRTKLLALEKGVNDPGLGARGEEIWARMLTVQERARLLRGEIERTGIEAPDTLDEEMTRRAKKVFSRIG